LLFDTQTWLWKARRESCFESLSQRAYRLPIAATFGERNSVDSKKLVSARPAARCIRNSKVKKRRHTQVEIAAKLGQADYLATHGAIQKEIARELGVTVMTLHRWRRIARADAPSQLAEPSRLTDEDQLAAQLELENSRLRTLLTDLLLENMRLEEAARGQTPGRTRKTPK
jgi:putative transposase